VATTELVAVRIAKNSPGIRDINQHISISDRLASEIREQDSAKSNKIANPIAIGSSSTECDLTNPRRNNGRV
jgi:hypothetical protein